MIDTSGDTGPLRTALAGLVDAIAAGERLAPDLIIERGLGRRRRRRIGVAASVLAVATLAGGVYATQEANRAARSVQPATTPTQNMTTVSDDPMTLSLSTPAKYGFGAMNPVSLTVTNPGAPRNVMVEFVGPAVPSFAWVLNCSGMTDDGCWSKEVDADPTLLQPVKPSEAPPTNQEVRFDLALPSGTHTYPAFVQPPKGWNSYSVRIMDGSTELGAVTAPWISLLFPVEVAASQDSTTLVRGGPTVQFTVNVTNNSPAFYDGMPQLGNVLCKSSQGIAMLPPDEYTLEFYDGAWKPFDTRPDNLVSLQYALSPDAPGMAPTFRVGLAANAPADATWCEAVLTLSTRVTQTAPFFDPTAPYSQVTFTFAVK